MGLLNSLFGDWAPLAGAAVGAIAGGTSKGNSASQTTQLDPRIAKYIYGQDGNSGLLSDAQNIYQQQMQNGGLNDIQRQGLDMQTRYLTSPQYTNSYNAMMNQGMNMLNSSVAGNPFMRGMQTTSMPSAGGYQYTPTPTQAPVFRPTQQPNTVQAPSDPQGSLSVQGGGLRDPYRGSGSVGNPGGQGVSSDVQKAALGMMALGENPALRALSPAIAALIGIAGRAGADQQIGALGNAADKLDSSQALANLGFGTVSDADGNVRTYSSPQTIAAADALAFGVGPSWDDADGTRRALLNQAAQGGSGGSYGRLGTFGRNNMAGDASGMGFGGQSGFGGYGVA